MANRLPVESFSFPVEQIKAGYYTDAYFLRSAEILNGDNYHPRVLMQILLVTMLWFAVPMRLLPC